MRVGLRTAARPAGHRDSRRELQGGPCGTAPLRAGIISSASHPSALGGGGYGVQTKTRLGIGPSETNLALIRALIFFFFSQTEIVGAKVWAFTAQTCW